MERWNDVKGIRIRGTVDDRDQSGSFVWEDHWHGHYKMSRVLHTERGDRQFLQNPDSIRSVATDTQAKSKLQRDRRFDPISTLTTHAPAAAIALALQNPKYSIAIAHPSLREFRDLDCVKVSKRSSGDGAPTTVVLCSSHEGILKGAVIELANLKTPDQQLFEVIEYEAYEGFGGRQFPTHIVVHSPLGRVRRYTFSSFEVNPLMDAKAFREEAK